MQTGAPADPAQDRLGWENGYWHNESIAVNQNDGLSKAEREAYVSRSMARVEQIRRLEFKQDVPVNVITRSNYKNRGNETKTAKEKLHGEWNNQVWEALLISGENHDIQQELSSAYSGAVVGYYSPSSDEIKLILPSNDTKARFDNSTLVHELTHAVQDQHFDLTKEKFTGDYQDTQLAIDGLIEGDASYVEGEYADKCRVGTWDCVKMPSTDSNSGSSGETSEPNRGVLFTIYFPYAEGPAYVEDIVQQRGWDAIDKMYRNSPPASTEQVLHRTDDAPSDIEFNDTAEGAWKLVAERDPGLEQKYDVAGEASMYFMFWYQSYEHKNGDVSWRDAYMNGDGKYDEYTFESKYTKGWDGDRIYPYSKKTTDGTKHGYVWVTTWDSKQDATQFQNGYVKMLKGYDTDRVDNTTWAVQNGPFKDVFRVVQNGDRVVIVNGPSVEAVENIRPDFRDSETNPGQHPYEPVTYVPDVIVVVAFGGLAALILIGAVWSSRRKTNR